MYIAERGLYLISRAVVDASQMVISEVELLQPAVISVDICRNIAAAWFHEVPDVDISGTLQGIKVWGVSKGNEMSISIVQRRLVTLNVA